MINYREPRKEFNEMAASLLKISSPRVKETAVARDTWGRGQPDPVHNDWIKCCLREGIKMGTGDICWTVDDDDGQTK